MEGFKEIEVLPFIAKNELPCDGDCDLDIHIEDTPLAWHWSERRGPESKSTQVLYSHDNDLCVAAVVRKIFGGPG